MSLQAWLTTSRPLDKNLKDDVLKMFFACEVMQPLFTDEMTALSDSGDDSTSGVVFEAVELVKAAKSVVWREGFPISREVIRETQVAASARAEELSAAIRESKNQF